MNGYALTAALWYIVMTAAAMAAARSYDRWISRPGSARVLPTSMQVVIGVAGVEALRMLRALPLAIVVAATNGWGWMAGLLIVVAVAGDGLIGYLAAGVPMVAGDLLRESQARHAAEAQATERLVRLAREAREAADDAD